MPTRQPNILFLLPDQHRPDFLGVNPDLPLRMPHLDGIIARGVRFTNAVTPSPLCAPARACLASGMEFHRCRVANNKVDYPLDLPTYYQSLRAAGYEVAGVGKFDLHKGSYTWGADGAHLLPELGFTRGIDNEGKMDAIFSGHETPSGPYMHYLERRGLREIHVQDSNRRRGTREDGMYNSYACTDPTPLPDDAYFDNWVAQNGLDVLRDFATDKPWHLVVNFPGPHNPMDITADMEARWRGVEFPLPHRNTQCSAEMHQAIRQNYAAMLENIDDHVGRFLAAVEARDELDNTLVIYSSDHGDMLGDHNRWMKQTYYQPSSGIPLVIAGPGVRQGVTSDALTSLHDLTATILDVANAAPLPDMESRSLCPVLTGETESHRDFVLSALNNWRMIADSRYKLVEGEPDGTILFDRVNDPWEDENIADQCPGEVARLREMLREATGVVGTPVA